MNDQLWDPPHVYETFGCGTGHHFARAHSEPNGSKTWRCVNCEWSRPFRTPLSWEENAPPDALTARIRALEAERLAPPPRPHINPRRELP